MTTDHEDRSSSLLRCAIAQRTSASLQVTHIVENSEKVQSRGFIFRPSNSAHEACEVSAVG